MKTIFYDFDADRRISSLGVAQTTPVKIPYQSADVWHFRIRNNPAGTLSPVDLSAATAWRAAVDTDYNHDTAACCRVFDADIDASGAVNGDISFPLDSNTSVFLEKLGTNPTVKAYFELAGFDSAGAQIFYFAFPVELVNTLDPSGGDPPEPVGNYYDKTDIDARISGLQNQLAAKADKVGSDDIEIDTATAGVVLRLGEKRVRLILTEPETDVFAVDFVKLT